MTATPSHLAYIGLGSNLGRPVEQVSSALVELAELAECELVAASSLYRSAPVGPQDQPDYINAVVALRSRLNPLELLKALQAIEQAHERVRLERWGPRTLDLDLLLYDGLRIGSEVLSVPHPELYRRNFVLIPLLEIAPDLVMPCGRPLAALAAACPGQRLERIR